MNANHSRVRDIFDRFDTDGNGTLSEAEFLMGLGSIGLHLTPQEMHMTLEGITDDGDDEVSYEELKTYIKDSKLRTQKKKTKKQPPIKVIPDSVWKDLGKESHTTETTIKRYTSRFGAW
jgi:hypothetical protein